MTASRKTDNYDPRAKLNLRRYFLQKYHPQGTARVLDCCMGSGFIWRELRREWRVASYMGLDVKRQRGCLKIDSARYLEAGGWDHNVIDIDTYGSPWRHWFHVLRGVKSDCTVFLTIGMIRMSGCPGGMQTEARAALGLPDSTPPGILGSLHEMALRYCLGALARYGLHAIEAVEAESTGNARYIGVRLGCKMV